MLPNHIQTCLSLLVKSWRVAVPAGKTSRQGHTVPASSQEYTFHLREEVSGESACRPTAAVGELNWWERTKSTTAADLRSVSTWCLFRAEKCLLRWLGSRCTCVLTTAACDRRRRCLCLSSVCVFFEDIRARWVKVMIHRRQKYCEYYRWGQGKVKKKKQRQSCWQYLFEKLAFFQLNELRAVAQKRRWTPRLFCLLQTQQDS